MELLEENARAKAGMGEDWFPYSYKVMPGHPQPMEFAEIIGAVAPLKTRGKNKGAHNWSQLDPATKRTVYITVAENEAFVKEWEKKTGLCANCKGDGQEWCGWGRDTGNRFRTCEKCKGEGKSTL